MLGRHGLAEISPEKDKELKEKWEKSDLWPITLEQATSVSGGPGRHKFSKFCPEVLYNRFGLFAEKLIPHPDEYTLERLIEMKGSLRDSWEVNWALFKELHYSNCPLYSVLQGEETGRIDRQYPEELFELR